MKLDCSRLQHTGRDVHSWPVSHHLKFVCMRTLQLRHFVLGCGQQGSVCLQEVWLALNDKHVNLTKHPALSSADIKDVPQALIKLMQQCWHKVCLPRSEPID